MTIEIIASIPLLSCPVEEPLATSREPVPCPPASTPPAAPQPPSSQPVSDPIGAADAASMDSVAAVPDRRRVVPLRRRLGTGRTPRLASPSLVLLAAVAMVCWMAALRNDRLRLEAARSQRPDRSAHRSSTSVGPHSSVVQ